MKKASVIACQKRARKILIAPKPKSPQFLPLLAPWLGVWASIGFSPGPPHIRRLATEPAETAERRQKSVLLRALCVLCAKTRIHCACEPPNYDGGSSLTFVNRQWPVIRYCAVSRIAEASGSMSIRHLSFRVKPPVVSAKPVTTVILAGFSSSGWLCLAYFCALGHFRRLPPIKATGVSY